MLRTLTASATVVASLLCAAPALATCTPDAGVVVRGEGRGLSVALDGASPSRTTVSVVREAIGRRIAGEPVVDRFPVRGGAGAWDGVAARHDGLYALRIRLGDDVREVVVQRSHARWRVRPSAEQLDACGPLRDLRAARPVFGGRQHRTLVVSYRLARSAQVSVRIFRAGREVGQTKPVARRSGPTYTLHLPSDGLARGEYSIRVTAVPGGESAATATVVSRRV